MSIARQLARQLLPASAQRILRSFISRGQTLRPAYTFLFCAGARELRPRPRAGPPLRQFASAAHLEGPLLLFVKRLSHVKKTLFRLRALLLFLKFSGRLAWRTRHAPRHQPGVIRVNGLSIQYTDLLSFYMEYKDIFLHRIYHFETANRAPLVVDGGSCIGMSVLYFKQTYPDARVICFEPDSRLYDVLARNVQTNALRQVTLVQAGLGAQSGTRSFLPDYSDGGKIVERVGADTTSVDVVRLSDFIHQPVDFLKLNIEGQELPVLEELEQSGKLGSVNELVVEYHAWPTGDQRLDALLNLLDRNGFRYMVHDFDAETCPVSKPPFHLETHRPWFCLVYGKRQRPHSGDGSANDESIAR